MIKKLPIGIQSIREILEEGCIYVDKTGFAKDLIDNGKHYFMSRPRRFGKSLFLNTIEEIFKGNKELFKGLKIYESKYNWQKHPVLYFDFAQILNTHPEQLELGLKAELQRMGKSHGIAVEGPSVQFQLKVLIEDLSQKSRVVVLVDEYDSAIINNLKQPEIAEKNRNIMKGFFATLKGLDRYLKFTFVTGVSKFSQVSLFSGPNNLTDITMDSRYAAMMGYTEDELKRNFTGYIQKIAKERGEHENIAKEELIVKEVRDWYNGYRFSEEDLSVYNPYSTLLFFNTAKPKSYWYRSGTPSFLIDQINNRPQSIIPLRGMSAIESTLSDISRVDRINLAALMFQTGYLTIKGYKPEERSYQLDFPNREVKDAFFSSLLQEFTEIDPVEISRSALGIKQSLEALDIPKFVDIINTHFAKMPYHVFGHAKESFYQAVFFTFLETAGIRTSSEIATNIGRIDLMTETPEVVCIFELKLDKTADIALTQAETKKYRERFAYSTKNTAVFGINFSSKTRNISDWKGKIYSNNGNFVKDLST
ncbi:MAG: AAA family ATPase (plasmid) [Candidatus Algichlamydia australiensis]|nr:AAA family ATPase [Chlamydiales bacterium]